ncbi:MAG: 3-deoxy-8-phosphooctulonate synthase [Candidatus Wallbacteria bacterium]|nr:3-deoxy-8-phosphooctulonate synthase [Candidatus Wallbacteria bacterium]
MPLKKISISTKVRIGIGEPLTLIAGPCVIEPDELILRTVGLELKKICQDLGINFIFKTSYDKANRSAGDAYRGPGLEKSLPILEKLKKELEVPLLIDIHQPSEAKIIAAVADVLQIPAFLCRQTDLLTAAAETGKVVNLKKGQFLAPSDVRHAVKKIEACGNQRILLTERGASFGYHNLVVDMRSFEIMKKTGYPVIFDATHSVQLPGAGESGTAGEREYIPLLAKAALAAGANALFMEVHPEPDKALCDASNQFRLSEMDKLLRKLTEIYRVVNSD